MIRYGRSADEVGPQPDMPTPERSPHYLLGVILVLASGTVLSTLGVGLRQVEFAGGWQILFCRSISFTLMLLLIIAVRYRGGVVAAFRSIGRRGFVVALFLATSSLLYVFAMLNTTVANATFIVSTTPFMAAALGWLVLRESVAVSTWIAMAVALTGVGLMVVDGMETGSLIGVGLALAVAFFTACMMVTVRGATEIDMIPALVIVGMLTGVFTACMVSDFEILDPRPDGSFPARGRAIRHRLCAAHRRDALCSGRGGGVVVFDGDRAVANLGLVGGGGDPQRTHHRWRWHRAGRRGQPGGDRFAGADQLMPVPRAEKRVTCRDYVG